MFTPFDRIKLQDRIAESHFEGLSKAAESEAYTKFGLLVMVETLLEMQLQAKKGDQEAIKIINDVNSEGPYAFMCSVFKTHSKNLDECLVDLANIIIEEEESKDETLN